MISTTLDRITPREYRGKVMALRLKHRETGEIVKWSVWRDCRGPASWMLLDETGYAKTLEANWRESVPVLQLRAENYNSDFIGGLS